MSFAAESYPYIADQLLTALTGGVARESHRFFPDVNIGGFAFELQPEHVLTDTLRVSGQTVDGFFVFADGRDYVVGDDGRLRFFASKDDPLQPDTGTTWPLEGTEFFVSYYHDKSFQSPITDRNVGSINRVLAESFARELAVLRKQIEGVYKGGFVDTAEGDSLDKVVALLGIERKGRDFAQGKVRFLRDTPAPGDIFIPDGTKVSTALAPQATFVTTEAKTLRRGQISVEIGIRAEDKGAKAVVPANTITILNQSLLGITQVVNDEATLFGATGESDAELRSRAKKVAERIGRATPRAMLLALTGVGLKENQVKVQEFLDDRPGFVQIFLDSARNDDASFQSDVVQAILDSRPAGVRVEHNLAIVDPSSASASSPSGPAASPADSARDDEWEAVAPPPGSDFALPILCDVLLFPENPRLAGPEKTAMQQSVETAVQNHIDNLPIGGMLVYNRLIADIMAVTGLQDCVAFLAAVGDPATVKRNVQIPEGKKAVLDATRLNVHFSGDLDFDFSVRFKPKGSAKFADAQKEIVPNWSIISPPHRPR